MKMNIVIFYHNGWNINLFVFLNILFLGQSILLCVIYEKPTVAMDTVLIKDSDGAHLIISIHKKISINISCDIPRQENATLGENCSAILRLMFSLV